MVHRVEIEVTRIEVGHPSPISQLRNLGQLAEIHTPMMLDTPVAAYLQPTTIPSSIGNDREDLDETTRTT
jgi:hypothetical protein